MGTRLRGQRAGRLTQGCPRRAHAREDLADIINVAIEELVRQRFELPGFTTIQEEAQRGRAEVNRVFYAEA
jgi:hypothetical protein